VRWFSVSSNRFITREILREYKIGPGDETFLIGRLVTLEGRSKNTPIVRFGNIAMMPEEQIDVGGTGRDAFLVECRSLSGLSGSPVFVTAERSFDGDTIPKDLQLKPDPTTGEVGDKIVAIGLARYGPWLLGVDFAHMPLWRPVYKSDRETRTPCMVEANTGIACVVPAWKLLEILNDEDLVKQRKIEDKEIGQKKKQSTESSRG
jgi:hypothetical protein